MKKIIAHPGGAHFDDFCAVSLALNSAGVNPQKVEVVRRNPTPEELTDPDVWVVDVGGEYVPERHNFDHHHDLECPSSYILVAKYMGLEEVLSVMPWWEYKSDIDRNGPVRVSKRMGVPDISITDSPVEDWLVDKFRDNSNDLFVKTLMADYGRYIIKEAKRLKEGIDYWLKNGHEEAVNLGPGTTPLVVVFGETQSFEGCQEAADLGPAWDAVVLFDNRGPGLRIQRLTAGHERLNFYKTKDREEVRFTHKGGFTIRTDGRLSREQTMSLIKQSIV